MISYSITKVPSQVILELAFRFKKIRKAKKYSQLEFASRSGVSLGSLKRFEQTGQISLESLLKLAHLSDNLEDFDAVFAGKFDMKAIEKLFIK
ncbi:MAG: helix-turn-helix transcriptional regulator [Flavobacterium sp.]|nr:helix-turn-helix transcriptional regulator [Flavobacterium sp.]